MNILETFENSIATLPPGVLGPPAVQDLDGVVRLHLRTFPDSFITPFGRRFIRLYYEALLSFPGSIFVVYRDDSNHICGMAAGAQFICQVGADETPSACDQYIRHIWIMNLIVCV